MSDHFIGHSRKIFQALDEYAKAQETSLNINYIFSRINIYKIYIIYILSKMIGLSHISPQGIYIPTDSVIVFHKISGNSSLNYKKISL